MSAARSLRKWTSEIRALCSALAIAPSKEQCSELDHSLEVALFCKIHPSSAVAHSMIPWQEYLFTIRKKAKERSENERRELNDLVADIEDLVDKAVTTCNGIVTCFLFRRPSFLIFS